MSPRVRVAPVTHAWTCVLLRPIVARVIKIFEPMNIPDWRDGDVPGVAFVADKYRRLCLRERADGLCPHFEIDVLKKNDEEFFSNHVRELS